MSRKNLHELRIAVKTSCTVYSCTLRDDTAHGQSSAITYLPHNTTPLSFVLLVLLLLLQSLLVATFCASFMASSLLSLPSPQAQLIDSVYATHYTTSSNLHRGLPSICANGLLAWLCVLFSFSSSILGDMVLVITSGLNQSSSPVNVSYYYAGNGVKSSSL